METKAPVKNFFSDKLAGGWETMSILFRYIRKSLFSVSNFGHGGIRLAIALIMWSTAEGLSLFAAGGTPDLSAVVEIVVAKSEPDYHQPWQNHPQIQEIGTACVIEGAQILTTAHMVADSTYIMVRRQGDPKRYAAKVAAIGHECDLAVLQVEDESFFRGVTPFVFGDLPRLQDVVTVYGYPVGGDNISITRGVVSRIEMTSYSHSGLYLLAVQVDAAINPGNSGGPVVLDGRLAGIAFQTDRSQENMGYMVPVPVILHFLKYAENGLLNGFPRVGTLTSKMENSDLREWARMKPGQTGVLVSYVAPSESAKNTFKVNDVILEIAGVSIANDETVPLRGNETIHFANLIRTKFVGDSCRFRILRDGQEVDFDYVLGRYRPLVHPRAFDKLPEYYVFGGFVFVPLTQNYLDAWGDDWRTSAPNTLVRFAEIGEVTEDLEEVVVLSSVLADVANIGYQEIAYATVTRLNGEAVRSLRDLADKLEAVSSGFVEIVLEDHRKIVLDAERARAANPGILARYRIDSDRNLEVR
jgi:S1-C subfamily serine protease